jgi:hypothetical protein
MRKLFIALALGLAILTGCATAPVEKKVDVTPLVVINDYECRAIEYQIGEWIDENKDGKMQRAEWYIYVNDTLEPSSRKEYLLPHGYYVIRILVTMQNGEQVEAWASGPLPDPTLKPNEKPTLAIGCGEDHEKKHGE